ncbi:MAG: diaminopimelate epimerase [Phycisphaeraceae bacterium]
MNFTKMHGIGNDYIYVNGFVERVDNPAALAVPISDRHFGVGGDGLILILPPTDGTQADVRMRMFNADGSESEMCGNGVRCVAKYTIDHGLSRAKPLRVQTGHGVLSIDYQLDARGKVASATVNMGPPILEPAQIPVTLNVPRIIDHDTTGLFHWHTHDWLAGGTGLDQRMTCVSMGNPHLVFFCADVAKVPLESVGPLLERHPLFPRRINVHFVQPHSRNELTMRTWERGSGITLACGTGASAVCVAGVLTNRSDGNVLIHLPGGDLTLEWRESDNNVYMTGPATEVFTGSWH